MVYSLNFKTQFESQNFETGKRDSFLELNQIDVLMFNLKMKEGDKNEQDYKIKGVEYMDGLYDKLISG